jgi:hypothetical protein
VIQRAPDFEEAACKCQTEDCEIIDFRASLFISKRTRFNDWKTGFRTKSLRSRMVGRMRLVLAQILAQTRQTSLRAILDFLTIGDENAANRTGFHWGHENTQAVF